MALTTEQMETKLVALERYIAGLQEQMNKLKTDLEARALTSDLRRTESLLRDLIRDNSRLINTIEQRLSKVILPEETRYYLDQGEVEQFQSNFNQLRAMMAAFDKLYKNLVAYASANT